MHKIFTLIFLSICSGTLLAKECFDYDVSINSLTPGSFERVNLTNNKIKLGIYMRTEDNIKNLLNGNKYIKEAVKDTNRPPPDFPTHILVTKNQKWISGSFRSDSKKYFVFFAREIATRGDKYCQIVHYPKSKPSGFREPNFYSNLGESWAGGFVDHCYGIGYGYSGRPIYSVGHDDTPKNRETYSLNLVVPTHKYDGDKIVVSACNKT